MKKIIAIFLAFLVAEVCIAQKEERDIPKGVFEKVTIPKNSYNQVFSVYQADAATLAQEWNSTHFLLQNERYATGIYPPNSILSTNSKSIILPQLNENQKLILQIKGAFETETGYDFLWILVSTDGGIHYTSLGAQIGKCDDWDQTIDLSKFAGKEIILSFRLNSDESFEGSGCSLDSVDIFVASTISSFSLRSQNSEDTIAVSSSKVKKLQITGTGTDNYPADLFIYFTATDDEGNYVPNLKQEDITLTINGKSADKCMSLQENTNTPVDIAFLMDNSGSMSTPIANINAQIEDLIDSLSNKFEVKAGLYRFGSGTNTPLCPGEIVTDNKGQFFWNLNDSEEKNTFKTTIWGQNTTTRGDIEKYYEVFSHFASMDNLNYNDNAKKVIIMIGDESVTGSNATNCEGDTINVQTEQTVIDALKGKFTVINIVRTSYYSYFSPISAATGGTDIDIYGSYDAVMSKISEVVKSTYVLRVDMSCLNLPTDSTCTSIIISLQGEDIISVPASDTICPYLKESVVMRRTNPTVDLDTSCVNPWDNVSLGVYLTGVPADISPDSIEVTAYISDTAKTGTSLPAHYNSADNSYYVTVPASFVNEPYFKYRFQANVPGAGKLIKSPNGGISEWTVAVCENYPPVISNVEHACSDSLQICADVTDATQYVNKTRIYYRELGTVAAYSFIEMEPCADSTSRYCATIPSPGAGINIEYYIYAEDNYGAQGLYGSPEMPDTVFCSCIEVALSSNPITSVSDTLTFALPESSRTTVYLLDRDGKPAYELGKDGKPTSREIGPILDEMREAGTHKISLKELFKYNLDPLTPYILVIETDEQKSFMYLYVSKI